MDARSSAARVLVDLTSLVVLAACASTASPTSVPASPIPTSMPSVAVASPTPAPTPSPTTVAAPGPPTYGPVSVVTGTNTCSTMDWTVTTDPDGTHHVRHGTVDCTTKADDPRVSGRHTDPGTVGFDLWGNPDAGRFSLVQWATVRLENDGGTWEGQLSGIASLPGWGDIITIWYRGTGGYAGLSYFELHTGQGLWKIQGQVFPGDPPLPYSTEATGTERPEAGGPVADKAVAVVTGTGTCPTADLGNATTDADGVTHYRGGTFRCTVTTDDPRVDGTETAPWNMDLWGTADNGALVQWGTSRLENVAGAWEGAGSGVYSSDRGDIIAFWYKGTGSYAGLSYFELWTGSDPWTIRGLIFPGNPPTP